MQRHFLLICLAVGMPVTFRRKTKVPFALLQQCKYSTKLPQVFLLWSQLLSILQYGYIFYRTAIYTKLLQKVLQQSVLNWYTCTAYHNFPTVMQAKMTITHTQKKKCVKEQFWNTSCLVVHQLFQNWYC